MTSSENPLQLLAEQFTAISEENATLKEDLESVKMMLAKDDYGWSLISGIVNDEKVEGLSLDEAKYLSSRIRPHVVGNGLVKRGADTHSGYVWSKGMNIDGAEKPRRGAPNSTVKFVQNPVNRDALFSSLAHEELQKARYADGTLLLACEVTTKTVRRIPLSQISGMIVNPDFPDEVWAYQRTWNPTQKGNTTEERVEWYYTNRFPSDKRKQKTINRGGKSYPVNPTTTIIDKKWNRQTGWPLGIPDAVAAMPWIAAYTEIIQYGRVVNESLAKILFKIINKTSSGAKDSAVKMSTARGFGNTASMAEGQDVQAISTAGKGYDFTSARPVAAMAASALNISVVELLSDSSAAGSSYGAAQTLTPSTRNAMRLMQDQWIELYQEVFDFFGLKVARIWFESLDDIELYREAQALTLLRPALQPEEIRAKSLDLMDLTGDPTDIPDTLKPSLENEAGMNNDTSQSGGAQAASPDQGRSNGTGGTDSALANDQRSDTVSETLRQMQNENFLDRFESLVSRAENLAL